VSAGVAQQRTACVIQQVRDDPGHVRTARDRRPQVGVRHQRATQHRRDAQRVVHLGERAGLGVRQKFASGAGSARSTKQLSALRRSSSIRARPRRNTHRLHGRSARQRRRTAVPAHQPARATRPPSPCTSKQRPSPADAQSRLRECRHPESADRSYPSEHGARSREPRRATLSAGPQHELAGTEQRSADEREQVRGLLKLRMTKTVNPRQAQGLTLKVSGTNEAARRCGRPSRPALNEASTTPERRPSGDGAISSRRRSKQKLSATVTACPMIRPMARRVRDARRANGPCRSRCSARRRGRCRSSSASPRHHRVRCGQTRRVWRLPDESGF